MKPNRKWDPLRPVRVRRDPPTLEEAVVAAQGLSDDIEQQVEIASGLMGVPQEEVRPVIASAPPSETARRFRAQLARDAAGGCPQAASGALRLPAIAAP